MSKPTFSVLLRYDEGGPVGLTSQLSHLNENLHPVVIRLSLHGFIGEPLPDNVLTSSDVDINKALRWFELPPFKEETLPEGYKSLNAQSDYVLVLKPGETIKKETLDRALSMLYKSPPNTVISFLHQDLNYPDPYHHRLFRLGQGHRFKINELDPSSWQHLQPQRGKLTQIYLPSAEIEVIPSC